MEDIEIMVNKIGSGTYSSVYKARYKGYKKLYALKRITKSFSSLKEEKIHLLLYHENIIRLYRYFTFDNVPFLLMEFAEGGNLKEKTNLYDKSRLPENLVKVYTKQILASIEYCHNNCVIHRDVKPENFLIVNDNIKLCDFGLSVLLEKINGKCYDFIGTIDFMAPELVNLNEEKGYGIEVDVWAIGVVVFEILTGITPFYYINTSKYQLPKEFKEWENFFSQIFQIDPSKRATANILIFLFKHFLR